MISKIIERSLKSLCYRFVLLIVLERQDGGGEMLCLHRTKRIELIQKQCLSAGAAANGLGAQVNYSQGRAGKDCTRQGEYKGGAWRGSITSLFAGCLTLRLSFL